MSEINLRFSGIFDSMPPLDEAELRTYKFISDSARRQEVLDSAPWKETGQAAPMDDSPAVLKLRRLQVIATCVSGPVRPICGFEALKLTSFRYGFARVSSIDVRTKQQGFNSSGG